MESAWRKAKRALALRLCVHVPAVAGDGGAASERLPAASSGAGGCRSEAAVTVASALDQDGSAAGALRRSKSGSRSSSKVSPSIPSLYTSIFSVSSLFLMQTKRCRTLV
jgi:hypothetical protein